MLKKIYFILNKKQKINFIFISALLFIAMFLEMVSISAILPLINFFIDPNAYDYFFENYYFLKFLLDYSETELLIFFLIVLFTIFILKFTYLLYLTYFQAQFIYEISTNIAKQIFKYYIYNEYNFHKNINSSVFIRNITSEIALFAGVISSVINLFLETIIIFGILILLLYVEIIGTVSAITIIAITCSVYYYFSNKKLFFLGNKRLEQEALQLKNLMQSFNGIKDIKISNKENYFYDKFKHSNKLIAYYVKIKQIIMSLPRILIELILMVSIILFIIITSNKDSFYSILPTLALFAAASIRIMPSISKILSILSVLRYSYSSLDHIYNEFVNLKKQKINDTKEYNKILFKKSIELNDIYFSYGSKKVFNKLNFKVNKSSKIGIVGKSGCGKTTLVDILLGMIESDKGQIICDGKIIDSKNPNWKSLFGYVPQKIYLLDDTIKNNIALGLDDSKIDINSINKVIDMSQLREFIDSLPNGINTIVGESGSKISGGQLQRIGIARALYNNPEIIIFDEATNALDPKTEKDLLKTINLIQGNKTFIIISHNLETLKDCEKIFEIINGTVK